MNQSRSGQMKGPKTGTTCSLALHRRGDPRSSLRSLCAVLLLMVSIPGTSWSQAQQQAQLGAEPTPEPAVTAILAAFDKQDVVGMPVAHRMKDVDDFILSL